MSEEMNVVEVNKKYTEFINSALNVGFTDSQANWLWDNHTAMREAGKEKS